MAITFSNATFSTSKFADLISGLEGTTTWVRLWTGNEAGTEGGYVDTSDFNDYGNGWIEVGDLGELDIDFAQADDTELWVQQYNDTEGSGAWEHGAVDFSDATDGDITTQISEDTSMDQMFINQDVAENGFTAPIVQNEMGQVVNTFESGDVVDGGEDS